MSSTILQALFTLKYYYRIIYNNYTYIVYNYQPKYKTLVPSLHCVYIGVFYTNYKIKTHYQIIVHRLKTGLDGCKQLLNKRKKKTRTIILSHKIIYDEYLQDLA